MNMRILKIAVLLTLLIIGLIACSEKEMVINEVHHHLNEAVTIEVDFESYQNELNELEKKDTELYNLIVTLSDNDLEEQQRLINDAKEVLSKKKEILKMISEMIQESKKEFEQIEPLMDKLEESEHIEQVQKMYDAMMERYGAYNNLYDSYIVSIELTNELYDLILKKDAESSAIFTVIKNVNESYDVIQEMNELFNKYTITYNALKSEFYDLIGENT